MKRALALAFILALLAVPASGISPSRWERVPESAFQSWPDVPGWSGSIPRANRVPEPRVVLCGVGVAGDPRGCGISTPTPTARPTGHASSTVSVKGVATFYEYHPGQAAAARRLRDALGPNWRGMTVRVCVSSRPTACLEVRLTDYESSTIPGRLIDLDSRDWAAICGPLSAGVCRVVVSR